MRIVHLVNHCDLGHGNAQVAVDLAFAQAKAGEQVWYASAGGDFEERMRKSGVGIERIVQKTRNPLVVLSSLWRLRRLIAREKIEIVHAHMMAGAVLGFLATRLTKAKLVTTVHNSFDSHSRLMRLGDRVVAVSDAERRSLLARNFKPERTAYVLNGPLESGRKGFGEYLPGVTVHRPAISCVAGLHQRKGVHDLIAAFAAVADAFPAHLHLVGDGPDRAKLEDQAAATGFGDRIHFYGNVNRPDQFFNETDIFVLASYAEPGGLVVFEARAAGCAMVCSQVGGTPEGLDGGEAGILFQAGDREALAGALRLLLGSPEKLAEMKARAKRGVERFTADRVAADYKDQYLVALGRRPAAAAAPAAA